MGEGGFARLRAGHLAALRRPRRVIHSRSASNPSFTKTHTKQKHHPKGWCFCLVGEGGFEPPKALPADLQSVPFGHSGIPPYSVAGLCQLMRCPFRRWSWWTDSNPRPADYKSAALPTELHQHLTGPIIIANPFSFVNSLFRETAKSLCHRAATLFLHALKIRGEYAMMFVVICCI